MHNNSIWKSFWLSSHTLTIVFAEERGQAIWATPLGAPLRSRECVALTVSPLRWLCNCYCCCVVVEAENKNLIFSLQKCMCDSDRAGGREIDFRRISSLLVALRRCRQALMSCSIRFATVAGCHRRVYLTDTCAGLASWRAAARLPWLKCLFCFNAGMHSFPHFPPSAQQ